MTNRVLCHKSWQVLGDLTFPEVGKQMGKRQWLTARANSPMPSSWWHHRVTTIVQEGPLNEASWGMFPGTEMADVPVGRDTLTQGLDS